MADNDVIPGSGSPSVQLSELPPSAIQAIYHAMTGKTESMSRDLRENVIVNYDDVKNVVRQIKDQIHLHHNQCEPTITVVVKHENDKSVTYSSWERFDTLQSSHMDVTSEIIIKFETVIRIPNTVSDQRIIIDLDIDSALPILCAEAKKDKDRIDFGYLIFTRSKWKTVSYKIDFVDFLVAKNFSDTIDQWFESLSKQDNSPVWRKIIAKMPVIDRITKQFGYLGASAFLLGLVIFMGKENIELSDLIIGISILLVILSIYNVIRVNIIDNIFKKSVYNLLPSVILINKKDSREFDNIIKNRKSIISSTLSILTAAIGNIALNILASYVYSG